MTGPERRRETHGSLDFDPFAIARRIAADTDSQVFTDPGTRALYTSDASNYRVSPSLVVAPRSAGDLPGVVAACRDAGAPLTLRGGGTSVAGNACGAGVVVDTSRHLTAVLDVDASGRTVTVEPGAVLESVNLGLRNSGLRIGPDPSSGDRCTIGGMIGNNACGPRSVRWGTTADAVRSLDLVLADGRSMRATSSPLDRSGALERRIADLVDRHAALIRRELPAWSRRVSGYALDHLLPERGANLAAALVGSEGTCAVVAGATLGLVPIPAYRTLVVLGFATDVAAAAAVAPLLAEDPLTVEGISAGLFTPHERRTLTDLLPPGSAWLLVEADGESPAEARAHADRLVTVGGEPGDTRIIDDQAGRAVLWRMRKAAAGRATRLPDGSEAWPGLEDAVVPPDRLPDYLAGFHALMADHGFEGSTFGHFGEGCLHVRIGFDLATTPGVERYERFMDDAVDLIVAHGGSVSGEHGDGRARSALLPRMFSPPVIDVFREFKGVWDPDGILNPGVVVEPAPIRTDLRQRSPTAIHLDTILTFTTDGGDFRSAVERCVGIGACVSRTSAALMCPSYQVTGEERDSTRGRARILQEMIAGDLAADGWRSRDVLEGLDLCLGCRGCLTDCPTGVDVATYKAEFLAHHYRGRLRPRSHYSLGRLPTWLRFAAVAPRLANFVMRRAPRIVGAVAGIAADRPLPSLAPRPFTRSFRRVAPDRSNGRVVLWPDTFNDHFAPEVLEAGSRVLSDAGLDVRLPGGRVCCGLTRIATGQLGNARRILHRTVRTMDDGDDPMIVLEPSCAATLRHDLPELLPDDPRALRLAARVATLAEVLDEVGYRPSESLSGGTIVQPHCHQQSVLGTGADRRVLTLAGAADPEMLTGCCGLAGGFGMEPGHRDMADAVAGLRMLPALEGAESGTTVLADGFSCRTQIEWLTGRRARHLAEVLADGLGRDR